MRIPDHIIDQVRSQADIVEIIGEHVRLKKAGHNYLGLCPFHTEKTPSFNVNPERGIFKCFGCGKAGNVITFISEHQHLGFVDTVRALAQRLGIVIPEDEADDSDGLHARRDGALKALSAAADYFHDVLQGPDGARAAMFLSQRGFSQAIISEFRIGAAAPGWDNIRLHLKASGFTDEHLVDAGLVVVREDGRMYDRFRDRAVFTIADDAGRVVGFSARILADEPGQPKYINSPQSLVFDKRRVLFGLDKAKRSIRANRLALLVEGQADVVMLHQHGFTNVVASSGTSITTEQLALLHRHADVIVILYDADAAGQKATSRAIELALGEGLDVRVVSLPQGTDPDSLVRERGPATLQNAIDQAQPWLQWQAERSHVDNDPVATAQTVRMLLGWIANVPDHLRRPFLVRELADRFRLNEDVLLRELAGIGSRQQRSHHAQNPDTSTQTVVVPRPPARQRQTLQAAEEMLLRVGLSGAEGLPLLLNQFGLQEQHFVTEIGRRIFRALLRAYEEHDDFGSYLINDPDLTDDERFALVQIVEQSPVLSAKWVDFDVEIPRWDNLRPAVEALNALRIMHLTADINALMTASEQEVDVDNRNRLLYRITQLIALRQELLQKSPDHWNDHSWLHNGHRSEQ
ncbi:MAG: DNA primase [Candidatus Kapabacteria bacterium]|nr:DNA primase [Candidatus Kapabacteria bacterium]